MYPLECCKQHLNLPNGLLLGIAKLLAKFEAILLHKSLRHFTANDHHSLQSLTHMLTSSDWHFLWVGTFLYITWPEDKTSRSMYFHGKKKIKIWYFLKIPTKPSKWTTLFQQKRWKNIGLFESKAKLLFLVLWKFFCKITLKRTIYLLPAYCFLS